MLLKDFKTKIKSEKKNEKRNLEKKSGNNCSELHNIQTKTNVNQHKANKQNKKLLNIFTK